MEDVARDLKAAVCRQLIDMPLEQFLKYCHVEQKVAMPDLEYDPNKGYAGDPDPYPD